MQPSSVSRYLTLVISALVISVAVLLLAGFYSLRTMSPRDHFGQIDKDGDKRWYLNIVNLATLEMQDRDILYHGIGDSIEQLKKADIVLLGHSVWQYAIDNDQMEAFERKYGVRIFNLNNPGIASGEYARQLIRKWDLKPKIWIINADDYPADFFNTEMDDFFATGRNAVSNIAKTSYLQSYINVASRGIRWRLEMALAEYGPDWLTTPPYPFSKDAAKSWRNIENGNFATNKLNDFQPADIGLPRRRGGSCTLVSTERTNVASQYISDIGGTVLLTLVPYYDWCPERIPQLATRLGLEYFLPVDTNFPLQDGRHMNIYGASAYTRYLLDAVSKTHAFKTLIKDPNPGTPPSQPVAFPSLPIEICLDNTSNDRLFVSVRSQQGSSDHAVEPGSALRVAGLTDGQLCSSPDPFNSNQCPNARYQAEAQCK